MTNRREFMQASAALAATALSGVAVTAATLPLYKIIFDERFAPARQFGVVAGDAGASVQPMRGEVHELWYNDLYHQWRAAPAAIAGMTSYNALFVLAMFAQDAGLRVIYRAHHRTLGNGRMTHEVYGPHALRDRIDFGSGRWGARAAAVVTTWPSDAVTVARAQSNVLDANRGPMVGPETMLSWIMAPLRRA